MFKNKGPWPKGKFASTHEGGVRVPFFVYWKDKIKAGENDHICILYDVLATSADLAGLMPLEDFVSMPSMTTLVSCSAIIYTLAMEPLGSRLSTWLNGHT